LVLLYYFTYIDDARSNTNQGNSDLNFHSKSLAKFSCFTHLHSLHYVNHTVLLAGCRG